MKRRFSAERLHKVIRATIFVIAVLIALVGVLQLYGSERRVSDANMNAYCNEHPLSSMGFFTRASWEGKNCYDRYAAYQQELAGRGAGNLVLAGLVIIGYGLARGGYKYLFPQTKPEVSK